MQYFGVKPRAPSTTLRFARDEDYNVWQKSWKLSISIGAVHVDSRHQLSIEELLGKADVIMYDRKRAKLAVVAK